MSKYSVLKRAGNKGTGKALIQTDNHFMTEAQMRAYDSFLKPPSIEAINMGKRAIREAKSRQLNTISPLAMAVEYKALREAAKAITIHGLHWQAPNMTYDSTLWRKPKPRPLYPAHYPNDWMM